MCSDQVLLAEAVGLRQRGSREQGAFDQAVKFIAVAFLLVL